MSSSAATGRRTWLFAGTAMLTFAGAVPMRDDPNGFEGIPWGSAFTESDLFVKVEDAGWIQTFELKGKPPAFGNALVNTMRFMTVDGKFARVIVRYQGKDSHDRILAYLQQRFGQLDRTPGQSAEASVKLFSWIGIDSEITLRYEPRTDQGIIFFESQTFRARLADGNSATVF